MIPNLSIIPAMNAAQKLDLPAEPEELRRWLTRGDNEDLDSHLSRLHDSIIAQHMAPLAPRPQLALLRCFLSHVEKASRDVRSQNFGLALPLPAAAVDLTESLGNLCIQISNAYKSVVLETAECDNAKPHLTSGELAQACYGSLHYLAQVLYSAYQGYRPYPRNIWYDIHQLYQYAQSEEILKTPVRSFSLIGKDTDSFTAAYKRTLMLDFADPYRMPHGFVDGVYKSLHDWSSLIRLTGKPLALENRCTFLIDLEFDRAGIPLLPRSAFAPDAQHLVITCAELVAELNQQYAATEGMPDIGQRDLLRSLIVQWGVQPMRALDRKPVRKSCEIIIGLQKIDFVVEMADQTDDSESGDGSDQTSHTTWTIVDESPGGMQLTAAGNSETKITVGELVGVRVQNYEPDNGPINCDRWQVGVVRWVKNTDKHRSNLGIFILGTTRCPVLVWKKDEPDKRHHALIVDPKHADELPRLVTPNGVYSHTGELVIEDANEVYKLQIADLIAAMRGSDCFDYKRH